MDPRAVAFLSTLALLTTVQACSSPPEQPDLNTYGALQPLCVFWCRQSIVLTEGDGAAGSQSVVSAEVEAIGASAK